MRADAKAHAGVTSTSRGGGSRRSRPGRRVARLPDAGREAPPPPLHCDKAGPPGRARAPPQHGARRGSRPARAAAFPPPLPPPANLLALPGGRGRGLITRPAPIGGCRAPHGAPRPRAPPPREGGAGRRRRVRAPVSRASGTAGGVGEGGRPVGPAALRSPGVALPKSSAGAAVPGCARAPLRPAPGVVSSGERRRRRPAACPSGRRASRRSRCPSRRAALPRARRPLAWEPAR